MAIVKGKTSVTAEVRQVRPRVTNALFKATERFYLNFDSPIPLYHQIEKIILDRMRTEGAVARRLRRWPQLLLRDSDVRCRRRAHQPQ